MVKSEDFVILAVPDSLPVLEPDSLAPPTFILVGMAVLMIDVSVEKRDCVQYKNCNVRNKLGVWIRLGILCWHQLAKIGSA